MFPEPDRFNIARDPNPHVTFGSGIHHCLGATLARLEGQEAFKALAQRFNELSLETEHLEYDPAIFSAPGKLAGLLALEGQPTANKEGIKNRGLVGESMICGGGL